MVANQKTRCKEAELVTREQCEEAIRNLLGHSNFQVAEWSASTGQAEGAGFMGVHLSISVTVHVNGKEKHVNFFGKVCPDNESAEIIEGMNVFPKEIAFYNKLQAPLLKAWTEGLENGKPGFNYVARSYVCTDRLVIMDDLTKMGFRSVGEWEYDGLDYKKTELILRSLAGLHASSLVLQHGPMGMYPPDITKGDFEESFFVRTPGSMGRTIIEAGANAITNGILPRLLERLPNVSKTAAEVRRLKDLTGDRFALLDMDTLGESLHTDVKVVCHGDSWPNNVLMKFDDDGNPVDAILVDFQVMRWTAPAVDVMTLLQVGCRKKLRDREEHSLLRGYYNHLDNFTRERGVDLHKILSLDAFLDTTRRMKMAARAIAAVYVLVVAGPKEELASVLGNVEAYKSFMVVDRSEICGKWFDNSEKYRVRTTEVVCELLDLPLPPDHKE